MDILKKRFFNIKGLAIYIAIFTLVLTLGTSYAYFLYSKDGNSHELIAGNIYMNTTDTGSVSLTGLYPMSDTEGIENGIKYNFDVTGYNLSNKTIYYGIYINKGDNVANKTRFRDEDIKFYLTETIDGVTSEVIGPYSVEEINRNVLHVDTVEGNIAKETPITISYELTMWISDNVLISDSVTELEGRSIYTTEEFKNSYASIKVEVYGDFMEKDLPVIGYVTYDLSKIGLDNLTKTPIYSDKSGIISTEIPTGSAYEFLGWSTSYNGSVEYNPGDPIKEEDIQGSNLTLYPVAQADFVETIETSLATYLQAADTEGNRYLKSSTTNNYVWYSGKLWRIVSINSDGTIKLVTQGNMTTIAWNIDSTNTVYENSQIHNWLKNEFLPTIEPSVLAESTWDYTTYASGTATKAEPVNYVEGEKVGLLTIYDYYKVRNGSNSNFLNNGYQWWTMSPKTDNSFVWNIGSSGSTGALGAPTYGYGVRPSVNLKFNIQIVGGNGKRGNPYLIEGDKETGSISELLNNRISGEYINFNDVLYRIVGIEDVSGQILTKITMADYSVNKNTLSTAVMVNSSTSQKIYSTENGVGLYLDEWYRADSTNETYANNYIKDNYKAMIATSGEDGVAWYSGSSLSTEPLKNDYTLAKTGPLVSATIGMGYYGEMFSSQFGDGFDLSIDIWLITTYSASRGGGVYVNEYGAAHTSSPSVVKGVRPSMYLKSNVKITGGNGQPTSPYQITQ